MTQLEIILEVEKELERFTSKLKKAKESLESQGDYPYQLRDYAAAKRSALDLKNELTKLTQDSKYRNGK